jgi:predicted chitinase
MAFTLPPSKPILSPNQLHLSMKNKYLKRIKFTLCFCGWLLAFTNLAKAQENQTIQSTLTLVTTDIMNNNNRDSFSWKSMYPSTLVTSYAKINCNSKNIGNTKTEVFLGTFNREGEYGDWEVTFICTESGWFSTVWKKQSTLKPFEDPKGNANYSTSSPFVPWSTGLNSGFTGWVFVNSTNSDLAGGSSNNGDEQNTSPTSDPNKPQTTLQDDEPKQILNCPNSVTIKLTEYSDTCLLEKAENTYKVTTDCDGSVTFQLLNSDCISCSNYIFGSTINERVNYAQGLLYNAPYALLTIKPEQIQQWKTTINNKLTTQQIDYIDSLRLKAGASQIKLADITKLKNTDAPTNNLVYLDNFSVHINQMPVVNGKKLNPIELLDYVRSNLNQFTDTAVIKFEAFNQKNQTMLTSHQFKTTKKGVLLKVKTPNSTDGLAFANHYFERENGSVSNSILITTVIDPAMNNKRKFHTTTQIGYTTNADSTYTFYSKTASKATNESKIMGKIANDTALQFDEQIGNSFQTNFQNFVNQNGGTAIYENYESKRVNEENIKYIVINGKKLCELADDIFNTPKDTTIKTPCPTDANLKINVSMLIKLSQRDTSKMSDSLKRIFVKRLNEYAYYINYYAPSFKLNNRNAMACFLAIASQETMNFTEITEDYNYSVKGIRKNFDDDLFPDSIINRYVNCACVFDRAYAGTCNQKLHDNCDEASKDGSKYRGRGFFHLTHKDSYWRLRDYLKNTYNRSDVDIIANPELVADKSWLSVFSGMWELSVDKSQSKNNKKNALYMATIGDFEGVMNHINKRDTNKKSKRNKLLIIKKLLCL